MLRVVRAFLVWVLVIAMPVQGFAASAMVFCGPSHDRMLHGLSGGGVEVEFSRGTGLGQSLDSADHAEHKHHHMGHSLAHEATTLADADEANGLFTHHGNFSCSACAACCSALALPASFVLAEPSSPPYLVAAAAVNPFVSHQPDRLDRPPRALFA